MLSRQLLRAHSLCSSPPAACWALPVFTEQPTINIFSPLFSNIRQIFGPTVSVSGTAPSVQDLCLPSAVPTHLFPFDIHPSTSHNRFIVIFTISDIFSLQMSGCPLPKIYERVNIVESFPDPHRSLRFRNGTFDLREIPAQGKILNKFEVDSD